MVEITSPKGIVRWSSLNLLPTSITWRRFPIMFLITDEVYTADMFLMPPLSGSIPFWSPRIAAANFTEFFFLQTSADVCYDRFCYGRWLLQILLTTLAMAEYGLNMGHQTFLTEAKIYTSKCTENYMTESIITDVHLTEIVVTDVRFHDTKFSYLTFSWCFSYLHGNQYTYRH